MKFTPRIFLTLSALIAVASGCDRPTEPTPPVAVPNPPVVVPPPPPAAPPTPVFGENEVIFNGLVWICPMGCTVSIENFGSYVPTDTAIRVFVGNAAGWIEAKPQDKWVEGDRYLYQTYNSTLQIYGDDESGAVDVKITF